MMNYNDKIINYTYYSAFIGMLIGSFLFLILLTFFDASLLDYGLEDFKIISLLNISIRDITIYILKRRVCQILLFIILMALFSVSTASSLYNLFFGVYFGMIMSSMFIKFAWKGLVYACFCFFPHYIIYFFLIYFIVKWSEMEGKRKIYYKNVNKLQYLVQISVIFLGVFFAMFWEIKFQKNFLNYFFQYLV